MNIVRKYSTKLFSLRKSSVGLQPTSPVRTRFAPSPTGFLHLGSLRTALYNYLLARSTGGVFILRLEDTDQKRLVPGLEENIYETLKWLGLNWDEGPLVGGPSSPYRQSERSHIYSQYATQLLNSGKLYRCFCSKERLEHLRNSAKLLKPPTTVSYDRHCMQYTQEESELKLQNEEFTIRFKSPDSYPTFTDLLHGVVNLQPQINASDRRYDDLVLMKSDGTPTYHLANVIDDHLMNITHVIRGEEWLPSTPKHISLYNSFGWEQPHFVHIPLLTSIEDKKLSKRSGDIDIMSLRAKGYLKESLINFSVLFGWSPKRLQNESIKELYTLQDLEKSFSLDQLTRGNAKVDFKKLNYFNKQYLSISLDDEEFFNEAVDELYQKHNVTKEYISKALKIVGPSLTTLKDLDTEEFAYVFQLPNLETPLVSKYMELNGEQVIEILKSCLDCQEREPEKLVEKLSHVYKKKHIYQAMRLAISGLVPGLKLPQLYELLGPEEIELRIKYAIDNL